MARRMRSSTSSSRRRSKSHPKSDLPRGTRPSTRPPRGRGGFLIPAGEHLQGPGDRENGRVLPFSAADDRQEMILVLREPHVDPGGPLGDRKVLADPSRVLAVPDQAPHFREATHPQGVLESAAEGPDQLDLGQLDLRAELRQFLPDEVEPLFELILIGSAVDRVVVPGSRRGRRPRRLAGGRPLTSRSVVINGAPSRNWPRDSISMVSCRGGTCDRLSNSVGSRRPANRIRPRLILGAKI